MIPADGKFHTAEIGVAWIEDRPTRLAGVRSFFHQIMPSMVKPPQDRKYLHTSDGQVHRICAMVPSAEGARFSGSNLPLPNAAVERSVSDGFHDPLAVDLTPGAGDIPADGWPEELKPDVARHILEVLPDED